MPELNDIEWVHGNPVSIPGKVHDKKECDRIYVLFFWATYSNSSSYMIDFIKKEKELYEENDIVFIGISTENEKEIKDFLEEKEYGIYLSLGVDSNKELYEKYLKSTENIPMFFIIDGNGKLIWKGAPFEVNRILSRVINKTFVHEDQIKIQDLRKQMRKFTQIFDYKNKYKVAKKILQIDPTEITAVKIIIDEYIRKNRLEKALGFLLETHKQAQNNKYVQMELFSIELSIIKGMDPEKSIKLAGDISRNIYKMFYNDPKLLNEFTLKIINNISFPIRPLEELLKMSERAVSLEKEKVIASIKINQYLQTLAEVYYWFGMIEKAVKLQRELTINIDGEKDKKQAFLKYQYYKKVLTLKKQLQ